MLPAATQSTTTSPPASYSTAMAVALIAGVVFTVGYRIAVARRARADWRTTRAAVPKLRKQFWQALWAAAKFCFWALLATALLLSWVMHDVRERAGG